jgi:hypothetical protein
VKPKLPGIATDLVVVTNLRSYSSPCARFHLISRSCLYYPERIKSAEQHHRDLIKQAIVQSGALMITPLNA